MCHHLSAHVDMARFPLIWHCWWDFMTFMNLQEGNIWYIYANKHCFLTNAWDETFGISATYIYYLTFNILTNKCKNSSYIM